MVKQLKKTILVVDDHEDDRVLLKQLFESQGYQVLLADNGEIALDILTKQDIDFVFSDVLMPIMDGLQLCKIIKNSNELKHVTVVLYTSIYSDEEDMKNAIKIGVDHYLIKPIEPESILKIIGQSIEKTSSKNKTDKKNAHLLEKESQEDYFRLYSTQLVQRLEQEVDKLNKEVEKRKKIESEQREMLNSMIDGVITIDEKGKILSFNKAAEKIFGYSVEDVLGENVTLLMAEQHASQHDGYLKHYKNTGESHVLGFESGREIEGLRRNKEVFPMRILVAELSSYVNGKRHYIGSCQDLTHIKQQEEQLRRSQKMEALGKLTGGVAHDYNNMLGIILGYTELLDGALSDQPKLKKYIDEIQHAGDRGVNLTKKLLSFSRQKTFNTEVLNINLLLQDEQHMLQNTLTARIKLIFDLVDNDWMVKLNGGEFEDAIINLSINAMHAIEGHGELSIQTRNETLSEMDASLLQVARGDYVLLSLTDSGRGMDVKVQEKIFEPFYSTKGELGTGLGLSQVYGFVERSKGAIKVYSEVGLGTRFTLYFPRHIESKEKKKDMKFDHNQADLRKDLSGTETILLVDDEAGLRNMLTEILKHHGYHVLSAESGKQALELLKKEKIDLLFSDVIMPEMDGYQLAAIVQKKYPSIKIQLASGFSDGRHKTVDDGDLHKNLLNKPYHSQTLLKRIRDLLD